MVKRALWQDIIDGGSTGAAQTVSGAATTTLLEVTDLSVIRGDVELAVYLKNLVLNQINKNYLWMPFIVHMAWFW